MSVIQCFFAGADSNTAVFIESLLFRKHRTELDDEEYPQDRAPTRGRSKLCRCKLSFRIGLSPLGVQRLEKFDDWPGFVPSNRLASMCEEFFFGHMCAVFPDSRQAS